MWKPRRWPGLNAPGFDASFERQLQAGVKDAAFVYAGDLAEGEAYEGQLTQIEQVGDWSIVGLSDRRVSLIVDATIKVSVELQYEDRDSASWGQCARRLFLHTLFWLTALRGPSESSRDVILRLVEAG